MKWLFALCLVAVICSFVGCDWNGKHGNGKNSISQVDRLSDSELRQSLDKFEEFFANTIIDASDELDQLSPATRPNRSTLKLRSVTIKASGAMLRQDDALTAFIDVWVLCARLGEYFEIGFGRKSFSPNQQIVIEAVKKIQTQIENIGLEYLDEENFEEARLKVYEFAKTNPIKPGLKETVLFATETYEGEASPFEEIVVLPLIPLTMVNGMTEGVMGPGEISESVDHFADTIEAFPESARWQLLMLLYDIEKLDSVKSSLGDFSEFSNSTSRLADSAESLPEELRLELSQLLREIEEKTPNILKVLQSADGTSANIKEALETGDDLTRSINNMCEKIELAAVAWKGAADATDVAVSKMMELREPDFSSNEANFDINIYREAAREFNLVADKLPGVFLEADSLTKKLTRRIALLIVLVFAMIFAFTFSAIRLRKK